MTQVSARNIVNRTGGVSTEDGRMLYGMDAEVYLKMKASEDPMWESTVGEWVEAVLEEQLPGGRENLHPSLKNGILLCRLLNKIKENTIPKYNTKLFRGKLHPLSERENITLYLEACWKIGLSSSDIFVVADLHGRRGMRAVLNNIAALSQFAINYGINVEPIGPKKKEAGNASTESQSPNPNAAPSPVGKAPKKMGKDEKVRHWDVAEPAEPVYVFQLDDKDEMEEVEEELKRTTLKLEEAQRSLGRLENSKHHIDALLQHEKKKAMEFERELMHMRSTRGGESATDFKLIDELKGERDTLKNSIALLQKHINEDEEKMSLKTELSQLKQKYQKLERAKNRGGDASQFAELRAKMEAEIQQKEKIESELISMKILAGEKNDSIEKKMASLEVEKKKLQETFKVEMAAQQLLAEEKEMSLVEEQLAFEEEKVALQERINELELQQLSMKNSQFSSVGELEAELNSVKAEAEQEAINLKKIIERLDKEKNEVESEFSNYLDESKVDLDEAKRVSEEELKRLRTQVSRLTQERESLTEIHTREIDKVMESKLALEERFNKKMEKLTDKLDSAQIAQNKLVENHKVQLLELNDRIDELRIEHKMKEKKHRKEMDELIAEKHAIVQENFKETQRLEKEAWELEKKLRQEMESIRSVAIIASEEGEASADSIQEYRAQIEELKREKLQLEERYQKSAQQALQKHISEQDDLERQVLVEKRRAEQLESDLAEQRLRLDEKVKGMVVEYDSQLETLRLHVEEANAEKEEAKEKAAESVQDLQDELKILTDKLAKKEHEAQEEIKAIQEQLDQSSLSSQSSSESLKVALAKAKQEHKIKTRELKDRLDELEQEKGEQMKKIAKYQSATESFHTENTAAQQRFLEEMTHLRTTFQTALTALTNANAEILKEKSTLRSQKDLSVKELEAVKKEMEERHRIAQDEVDEARLMRANFEKQLLEVKPLVEDRTKKIKALEKEIMFKEVQSKMEISKLNRELKTAIPEPVAKRKFSELESMINQQKKYIHKLEKKLSAAGAGAPNKTPPPRNKQRPTHKRGNSEMMNTFHAPDENLQVRNRDRSKTSATRTRPISGTQKHVRGKSGNRFNRRSLVLPSASTLNQDLAKLRDVMNQIMLSDAQVPMDLLLRFKNLFKIDKGRRFFTFMLKEYSEKAAEGASFLVSSSSFEALKVLIDGVLSQVDLSSGGDFISGKILLETSSLIGREVRGSSEPEFLQIVIKPHECWQNTFFWEEYFWAQSTPKFQEIFGEMTEETENAEENEKAFFEEEIIIFVKNMYGWGNLPPSSMNLFTETLIEKTNLAEESRDRVMETIDRFQKKEARKARSREVRKTRIFMGTSPVVLKKHRMSMNIQPGALRGMRGSFNSSHNRTTAPRSELPSIPGSPKEEASPLSARSRVGGITRSPSVRTPNWLATKKTGPGGLPSITASPRNSSARPPARPEASAASTSPTKSRQAFLSREPSQRGSGRVSIGRRDSSGVLTPKKGAAAAAAAAAAASPPSGSGSTPPTSVPPPIPSTLPDRPPSLPSLPTLPGGPPPVVGGQMPVGPRNTRMRKYSKNRQEGIAASASAATSNDPSSSRKRLARQSMVIDADVNKFLDNMLDVYRMETVNDEDDENEVEEL
eukprot:TRINITY_DN438_c0_g1_i1.p1 TRINITY_DN438_c0_g1~~TRINITY_DN438_c0_g1_i1.p1  ORF type:complete len:1628 (-),score=558.16 TRINITY_DN438_c0_g1_i1:76-4959(-)